MGTMRNSGLRSDGYLAQIVDECSLADARPIPNLKVPRHVDNRRIVNVYVSPNSRPKTSQNEPPPSKENPWTEAKKALKDAPKNSSRHLGVGVLLSAAVCGDVEHVSICVLLF
jgi:hypothetical protein